MPMEGGPHRDPFVHLLHVFDNSDSNPVRGLCVNGESMRWWILLFSSLALLPAQQQTPPASSGFVGGAVCKTCHPDVWLNFYKNPHYKSVASGAETPERTGCESCHGPGKAHLEARGGKQTIPHAFSLMVPKQIVDGCLTCHAKDFGK